MKWADTQLATGSAAEFVAVKVSALLPKAALDAAGNLPKFHTTTKLLIFSTNQIIHLSHKSNKIQNTKTRKCEFQTKKNTQVTDTDVY
jgi:hypothetical protein